MSIDAFRQAVIDGIGAAAPDDVRVEAHPGRFSLKELSRVATGAPAIRVAVLDFQTQHVGGGQGVIARLNMAAYTITAGDRHADADVRALQLLGLITSVVDANRWDTPCHPPEDLAGTNLFSSEMARQTRAHLAAVTWTQEILLGAGDAEPGATIRDVWLTYEPDNFDEQETSLTDHVVAEESDDA